MIVTCSSCGWQQAEHSPQDFRCLQCGPKIYAPPDGAPDSPSDQPSIKGFYWLCFLWFVLGLVVGWSLA